MSTFAADNQAAVSIQPAPTAPVLFLFKGGRLERLRQNAAGPSEFFYGYLELKRDGALVEILDESVFGFDGSPSPGWAVLSRLTMALFGVHAWAVHRLARGDNALSAAPRVVTFNNAYGVALAWLKARGRLRPPVTFIAMGLLDRRPPGSIRRTYAKILRHVTLAVISQPERDHLASMLPGVDVHYVPFGVDHRFWQPAESEADGNYVLSIGNDPNRDYPTLINAWRPELPALKIVTRLAVPDRRPANVELIAGDWRQQLLTDVELRDLVRHSRFVVLPIRDTLQPSGQSACLQAMACGKAVVLSDIAGIWDRDLMRDGETCILVPPGDPTALNRAVSDLANQPDRAAAIGRAARHTVESHLNADAMARALSGLCGVDTRQAGSP